MIEQGLYLFNRGNPLVPFFSSLLQVFLVRDPFLSALYFCELDHTGIKDDP
jgi:hypothetical protein